MQDPGLQLSASSPCVQSTNEDQFSRLNFNPGMTIRFTWKWLLSLTMMCALFSLSQQVIQTGLRNTEVVEGNIVTLQVTLTRSGVGQGTWSKGGVEISSSGRFDISTNERIRTLTIRNVELVDTGAYMYTVDDVLTSAVVTVTVFRTGLRDTTVDVGATVYLQVILGRPTSDNGTWYKDGLLVEPEPGILFLLQSQNARQLVIYSATTDAAGLYTLGIRGQSTSARLRVGIMFESGFPDTTVRVGDNATLEVRLSQPNITTGHWSRNNIRLPSNSKYRISVSEQVQRLVVLNVRRTDEGTYTYTINDQKIGARVIVPEEQVLRFTSQPQPVTVPVGKTVVLRVSLSQVGVAQGVWNRDGTVLANFGNILITVDGFVHQLVIINATTSDSGSYTYNIRGLTTTADVTALDIRIVSPLRAVAIRVGSTAVLQTILSHVNIRMGSWFKDNSELTTRDNIIIATDTELQTLTIFNVQLSDVGLYRYRIGDRETTAVLSVRSGTSDVSFTICFVLDGSRIVESNNFDIMRSTVKSFISLALTTNPQTKACVVVFSDGLFGTVPATSNLTRINEQIDSLRYPGGGRATHVGINSARELLLRDTSLNPKFMVVITAGLSDNPALTESASEAAIRAGIIMAALGIDQYVRINPGAFQQYQDELVKIASSPNSVVRQEEFSRLPGLTASALRRIQALFGGIRILQDIENKTVLVGEATFFAARLSISGVSFGVWSRDGAPVVLGAEVSKTVSGPLQIISIPNVNFALAGTYTLTVGNSESRATLTAVGHLGNTTVLQGSQGIFTVQVFPSDSPDGFWSRNGVLTSNPAKYTTARNGETRQLIIRNVQSSDEGQYIFTINGKTTSGLLRISAIVIEEGLQDRSASVGGSVTFSLILSATDITDGQWFKNGEQLSNTTRTLIFVVGKEQRLRITSIGVSDEGPYSYSVSAVTTAADLTVNTEIAIQNGLTPKALAVGRDATFEVTLTRQNITTGVWYKDDVILERSNLIQISFRGFLQRLTISNVQLSDSGVYRYSVDTATTQALFTVVPQVIAIEESLQDRSASIGESVTFSVTLSQTDIRFGRWFKNGVLLSNTTRTQISVVGKEQRLRINNIGVSDEGRYSYSVSAVTTAADLTVNTECNADVFVVLDGSQFMGSTDFLLLKEILKQKISSALTEFSNIRFGMLAFGSTVTGSVALSSNRPAVEAQIDSLTADEGSIFAGVGINRAREFLLVDRPSTPKHMIVVIGSTTSSASGTSSAAEAAKLAGIKVKAVGLSRAIWNVQPIYRLFLQELATIASRSGNDVDYRNLTNLQSNFDVTSGVCSSAVDGGFTPWGLWDNPHCSVTCGGGIRRLTRRRTCDNPPPLLGGRNCTGDFEEINVTTCNNIRCLSKDLCEDALRVNGVGYRYHPADCDKYIQCHYNPNGNVVGVYRSCSFGYHWNQATLRCDESWIAACPLEKCSGSCTRSYKMEGSCRSYWKCMESHSEGRCCPVGQSFHPRKGCQEDYTCDEDCPLPYITRDPCDKRPDWDTNPASYSTAAGTEWVSAMCDAGFKFDILECGCVQRHEGTCVSSYSSSFTSQVYPSWMSVSGAGSVNNNIILNPTSKMVLGIEMTTINCPVVFTLRYRESSESSGRRVLASSSDCRRNNSLVIYADDEGIYFRLKSWVGHVNKMMISTAGMSRTEWKRVTVTYNSEHMVGIVATGSRKYVSRIHAPEASIIECGMRIGSDGSSETVTSFVGSIDTLSVYQCDPGDLY